MAVSKRRTFSNILYTCFSKGITLVSGLIVGMVIARTLSPSEYAVIGFANIVIGFLSHFSDVGIGAAVIRGGVINQSKLSTAFAIKLTLSTAAFAIAFLMAPFVQRIFDHPQTANVIRLLALNFLISTIGFLSMTMLAREMNYRALIIPGIVGAVVRSIMVVTLIWQGWKYWALVAAELAATFTVGIVAQLLRGVRVGIHYDRHAAQEYLRFGIPLFGSGLLAFLVINLDNFLVGAKLGSTKLGYYTIAFTWATFICSLLSDTVHTVLLPTFAEFQNDLASLRRWYLKTIGLVGFVAVVVNTAFLANAQQFLITFLGKGSDKWVPSTVSLQILCVYGIFRGVIETLGPCLLARGHTKVLLKATLVAACIEVPSLLIVLRTGRIELISAVVLLAYTSQVIVYLPHLRRDLSITLGDIVAQVWPVLPAFVAGLIATWFLPSSAGGNLFELGAKALFTASVVGLTHGLCTRFRCFREAAGMISEQLARAAG